ncbi:MAG: M20/M25/M40 family metallo-hydrolase [Gemmatimonadaceae bacterium]|nr:M20/M25/M40 family metallo-hydrolase [Gemmatimonadaceae bacterium]
MQTSLCRFLAAACCALLPVCAPVAAQPLRTQVDAWRRAHEREILDEAFALLSLPNVASDTANIARNVAFLTEAFARRGVALTALRAPSGGSPALFGELKARGATRTVVFYAHYDGQPVASGGWDGAPFTPELRRYQNSVATDLVPLPAQGATVDPEVRIRARSASDDKGPIVAMLAALDAMAAAKQRPSVNVKFFLEGEEEAGSNHLGDLLHAHRDKLAADAWLFFDGPVHVSGRPQIVLGVRGVMGMDVTFFGANRALHSGHYGNWAPNPAVAVAHFIASIRDPDGTIRIPGFYDDVPAIADADLALARQLSQTDDSVRRSLGLSHTEAANSALGERIMRPALNVRGIRAGNVGGGASNAVPTSASVSIDFRLVPDQQPARIRRLMEQHLAALGYTITGNPADVPRSSDRSRLALVSYDSGYTSVRVPSTLAPVRAISTLMARSYGRDPFVMPILGGSLPLFHFVEQLGATVITVPTVNADNSQHAPNENLRLQNLWDGIAVMAELMTGLGREWPTAVVK